MEVSVILVLQMRGRAGVIPSTASTHRALHQHKEPFPTGRPVDLCRDSYSHKEKQRDIQGALVLDRLLEDVEHAGVHTRGGQSHASLGNLQGIDGQLSHESS